MTETHKYFEWSGSSYRAKIARDVNHSGYTITTRAAHLMIECDRSRAFSVRLVVFGERSKRTADEVLDLTPAEIRTALDLPRDTDQTDVEFAQAIGADLAIAKKFARKDRKLEIFCDINGKAQAFYFSFSESEQAELRRLVGKYMDHHFPRN